MLYKADHSWISFCTSNDKTWLAALSILSLFTYFHALVPVDCHTDLCFDGDDHAYDLPLICLNSFDVAVKMHHWFFVQPG